MKKLLAHGNGALMEFSEDQKVALAAVHGWLTRREQTLTMGGYAGTGKTTLIRELVRSQRATVCAYTGKAVSVLRDKGVHDAMTIHSLLYKPAGTNDDGDPIFVPKGAEVRGLTIVDEASMINRQLHEALEEACEKILYVGDHGQLEPIGYDPGLMKEPEIKLEKIHRQAEGSEIIRFAHFLREGNRPGCWHFGADVSDVVPQNFSNFDALIVGLNATRHKFNAYVRHHRGFSGDLPNAGETLICLQNNRDLGIFNGMQIVVDEIEQLNETSARVWFWDSNQFKRSVPIYLPQLASGEKYFRDDGIRELFGFFDWGYTLTCHKAQGSEWKNVCVVEETYGGWDLQRWRYTAVTRASEKLTYMKAT